MSITTPDHPIAIDHARITAALLDAAVAHDALLPHPSGLCRPTVADAFGAAGPQACDALTHLTSTVIDLSIDVTGDPTEVHETLRRLIYDDDHHHLDVVDDTYAMVTLAAGSAIRRRTGLPEVPGAPTGHLRALVKAESARLFDEPLRARTVTCIATNTAVRLVRAYTDVESWAGYRDQTTAEIAMTASTWPRGVMSP